MVRDWTGDIRSLVDAWGAKRQVWVLCMDCGHASKLDPRTLLGRMRQELHELPFAELAKHAPIRCRRCRHRHVGFLPHYEPWPSMHG
jgi:DNA-directed RNA polymerase subunit RPC12/RpoP